MCCDQDCQRSSLIHETAAAKVLYHVPVTSYTAMCLWSYSLDSQSDALLEEIELDFTRAMNRIVFDQTVQSNPATFPFVTLPDPVVVTVPEKGERLIILHWYSTDLFLQCREVSRYPIVPVQRGQGQVPVPFPSDKSWGHQCFVSCEGGVWKGDRHEPLPYWRRQAPPLGGVWSNPEPGYHPGTLTWYYLYISTRHSLLPYFRSRAIWRRRGCLQCVLMSTSACPKWSKDGSILERTTGKCTKAQSWRN